MLLSENGYKVSNIDATVVLQRPKIKPYIHDMVRIISSTLSIDETSVNVKATTEEHLGFTGREEGIAAHAVALIYK